MCTFVEFSVVRPNGALCWLHCLCLMFWYKSENVSDSVGKWKPLYWLTEARSLTITVQVKITPAQGRQCSRDPSHCLIHDTVMSVVTSLSCRKGTPFLYLIMHSIFYTITDPWLTWISLVVNHLNIAIHLQLSLSIEFCTTS